ncbi:MAG TPA: hypothetical protein VNX70_20055, partial [Bryobacteraceae bacterium]|nr:hypothetical protein [Bryobacteraceae bacterium]
FGRMNPAAETGKYRDTAKHTILERRGQDMPGPASRKSRRSPMTASIDPQIKAWIDNVIAPALVDQWFSREASQA